MSCKIVKMKPHAKHEEEIELTAEEEAMLDDAIAEADAEPSGGVLAADFLRELRASNE